MKQEITINPFTRVAGKLEIYARLKQEVVAAVTVSGLGYRAMEKKLLGEMVERVPMLAARICGCCGFSHATAANRALASLGYFAPPAEIEELLLAFHLIEGHLRNFYYMILPDYAALSGGLPFVAGGRLNDCRMDRQQTALLEEHRQTVAAELRRVREAVSFLQGKWVHGLAEGSKLTPLNAVQARNTASRLERVCRILREDFALLRRVYEELYSVGGGNTNFIDFGCLHGYCEAGGVLSPVRREQAQTSQVTVDHIRCWTDERGRTDFRRMGACSHLFLAEYRQVPYEMGALARRRLMGERGGSSVMDRIGAIVWETDDLIKLLPVLLERAQKAVEKQKASPAEGEAVGCAPTCGGSVLHYIQVRQGRIMEYRIISPCHWNLGPQDSGGTPSPLQTALLGTTAPDGETLEINLGRIVHSFVPCLYCGG